MACRGILEGEGFKVETVENGMDALAYLAANQEPRLILLDMMMPTMNGREFMAKLTEKLHTVVPIPVFLVSANATENAGKEMGCDGFLKKPFSIDALLAIARSYCGLNGDETEGIQPYATQLRKLRKSRQAAGKSEVPPRKKHMRNDG